MITNVRCERCSEPLTFAWVSADGKNYHGHCLPVVSMLATVDHDTAANIARLTGQVADLKSRLDAVNHWLDERTKERDEARRRLTEEEQEVELKQAALTGLSVELDAKHTKLVEVADRLRKSDAQRDAFCTTMAKLHEILATPAWVNIVDHARDAMADLMVTRNERDEALAQVKHLQASIALTDKNTRRMQEELTALRDFKVMAEEQHEDDNCAYVKACIERDAACDALRKSDSQRDDLQRMLTACEVDRDGYRDNCAAWNDRCESKSARVHELEDRVRVLEGALGEIATGRYTTWKTQDIAQTALATPPAIAPPAETPAPTCPCGEPKCSGVNDGANHQCGGPGEACLVPGCRECGTRRIVARDASGDGLSRCGRCDGYDPCLRCSDLGQIDRLKDEMRTANESIACLRAELANNERAAWEVATRAHAATKAKLGRAVAALQLGYAHVDAYGLARGDGGLLDNQRIEQQQAFFDAARAILADAESKAAGEAWAEEEEYIAASLQQRHFDCPHDAEHRCKCAEAATRIDERVETALAAVDARRGGGR